MRLVKKDKLSMSIVMHMTERLIEKEPTENGYRCEKIAGVARRCGLANGTLENLLKGRLKFVERVEARVREAFIRMLENEISKATHDLQVARQVSDRMDSSAVIAAEASVLAAKKLVRELTR